MKNLSKIPTLLLDPAFEPLSIISARKALTLVTKGKATVTIATDLLVCRTFYVPSVIKLVEFPKELIRFKYVIRRIPQATRRNIIERDSRMCMYCGKRNVDLELEHILPRSRGGRNLWENLVASCRPCNQHKGDRTPEEAGMTLIRRPIPATIHTAHYLLRQLGKIEPAWSKFLWTDNKGDPRFALN